MVPINYAPYWFDQQPTWEQVPQNVLMFEGLEEYLPDGFSFSGEGYVLDWEAWRVPDGLPDQPNASEVLAVSVITGERALGQAVIDLLGGPLSHYVLDDRYTFVVTSR